MVPSGQMRNHVLAVSGCTSGARMGGLAKSSPAGVTETLNTRIGKLEFTHDFANGYPTRNTVETLYDERDFQRACQAYLWAIPAVSFAQWQHGQASFGAKSGDIAKLTNFIFTANIIL